MNAKKVRTTGYRLRRVRLARRKSLRVVAGLAGMSMPRLARIERGERALDKLSDLVALARVLEIAPSELTALPVPAPGDADTDSATEAVRLALDAIEAGDPGGVVLPATVLRDQVVQRHQQLRAGEFADVTAGLPGLIRNLHTTMATGADHDELLDLAVYLHVHVTRQWLIHAAAPTDLRRRAVFWARRLAGERDEVSVHAMAGFGVADVLLYGGAFESGQFVLDSLTLPPASAATAGLVGLVTATRALAAVLNGRPDQAAALMETAGELAARFGATGEPDSLGFLYGPADAAISRMRLALETDNPDQAVSAAQAVDPEQHPFAENRACYWLNYGCALARLPGRLDDAAQALRTAEKIFPAAMHRNPLARDVIAELLLRSYRMAIGPELRGLLYRAGLPF